jgi:hypothetical protein
VHWQTDTSAQHECFELFLCWGFFFVFALPYVSHVFTLYIANKKRVLMGILTDHDLWKDKIKLKACQTQVHDEWG